MNRQIKFRAWDGTKMLEPQDLSQNGKYWTWLGKQDVELMQFTGLLDKNGKEIYQGDLLKVTADKEGYGSCSYEGIVEVTSQTCGYQLKPIKPTFDEMEEKGQPWDSSSMWHVCEKHSETGEGTTEIIGNIYENPELLN